MHLHMIRPANLTIPAAPRRETPGKIEEDTAESSRMYQAYSFSSSTSCSSPPQAPPTSLASSQVSTESHMASPVTNLSDCSGSSSSTHPSTHPSTNASTNVSTYQRPVVGFSCDLRTPDREYGDPPETSYLERFADDIFAPDLETCLHGIDANTTESGTSDQSQYPIAPLPRCRNGRCYGDHGMIQEYRAWDPYAVPPQSRPITPLYRHYLPDARLPMTYPADGPDAFGIGLSPGCLEEYSWTAATCPFQPPPSSPDSNALESESLHGSPFGLDPVPSPFFGPRPFIPQPSLTLSSLIEHQRLRETVAALQTRVENLEGLFNPHPSVEAGTETTTESEPESETDVEPETDIDDDPIPPEYRGQSYCLADDSPRQRSRHGESPTDVNPANPMDSHAAFARNNFDDYFSAQSSLDSPNELKGVGTLARIMRRTPLPIMDDVHQLSFEIADCVPMIDPNDQQRAAILAQDPGKIPPPIQLRPVQHQPPYHSREFQAVADEWQPDDEAYRALTPETDIDFDLDCNTFPSTRVVELNEWDVPQLGPAPSPSKRKRGLLYEGHVQPLTLERSSKRRRLY